MPKKNSFTIPLTPAQQKTLIDVLRTANVRPLTVPYSRIAAEGPDFHVTLYTSGKCVVQGKGAEDWVAFTLEPLVLKEARIGYDEIRSPDVFLPHMGIDESGKGDFFGPLVIAAAYTDEPLVRSLQALNVRDSKTITSDRKAEEMAREIRNILGSRFAIVSIGAQAYNRLYASMRNVNHILAWGHARAIENLLEKVPACPRALSDQFGPTRQIEQALMKKGRSIKLEQRPKAEADMAVAAASILARAAFLDALRKMRDQYGLPIPKGASAQVQDAAVQLIEKKGPAVLLQTAKCHFRTTDQVLGKKNMSRDALGPDGAVVSKPKNGDGYTRFHRRAKPEASA